MIVAKALFNRNLNPTETKNIIVSFCADKLEKYKNPAKSILMDEF
jgi:hypothetical protein